MAVALTERNLNLCSRCQKCLSNGSCKLLTRYKHKVIFKKPLTDYWEKYYTANREPLLEKRREWNKNNKCKTWASSQVNQKPGKEYIGEKPSECSRCGKGGRIVAHHPDYTDPLTVEWLCNSCHLKEHRKAV